MLYRRKSITVSKAVSAAAAQVLTFVLCAFCLSACTNKRSQELTIGLNDANKGSPQRVIALSSSLAEIWLLAGGSLIGTSSDTLEREFFVNITEINNSSIVSVDSGIDGGNSTGNNGDISTYGDTSSNNTSTTVNDITVNSITIVGTVKEPGLEAVLDLRPDFVILSADIAGHTALEQALTDAGIECLYAHVETFADYCAVLELFCEKTGNTQMLAKNGTEVKANIDRLLDKYEPSDPPTTYLLLRVHSSGGKVIAEDHVACDILSDLGTVNIAANDQSLLSDLSLEAILESDPDVIYVVTMGDEGAALKTLEQMFSIQPAWQKLTAVINNRVHILPKELFHYKPNAKWGQAYETLIGSLAD